MSARVARCTPGAWAWVWVMAWNCDPPLAGRVILVKGPASQTSAYSLGEQCLPVHHGTRPPEQESGNFPGIGRCRWGLRKASAKGEPSASGLTRMRHSLGPGPSWAVSSSSHTSATLCEKTNRILWENRARLIDTGLSTGLREHKGQGNVRPNGCDLCRTR